MLERNFFPSHTPSLHYTHITDIGIPYIYSYRRRAAFAMYVHECISKGQSVARRKKNKYVSSEYCPARRHHSIDSNYLVHCVNPMTEPNDPNTPSYTWNCVEYNPIGDYSGNFFMRAEFPSDLPPHIVEHVAKTKQKKRAREK